MSRTLLVLFATSVSLAAPAPKATKDGGAYFPTKEGDKREYEVRAGDKVTGGYTDVVSKVEKVDGALHVTINREYADSAPYVTTIAVSAEGLFRVATADQKLDKPVPLLKLPATVGSKWESGSDGDDKTTYTVAKEEEVEVPAGKYKTVRVEATVGGKLRATLWFAPAVGLVKMTSGTDHHQVLKAFTPGK